MKTSVVAATALAILLIGGLAAVALANTGPLSGTTTTETHTSGGHRGPPAACRSLTAGENLTLTGLTGHFINASSPSGAGNASGTLDLKVSQIFLRGCTVSITGGSLKLGTMSFTLTSGSLVLNHGGRSGDGSGTASSSSSFLIWAAGLHGNSTLASVGAVRLDFKAGSSEFLVVLSSPKS